jgi:hypothetical protein
VLLLALAIAAVFAAARLLWLRPSRRPLRLLLQTAAAALLWLCLHPPAQPLPRAGALTVLSADWQQAGVELGPSAAVVALPEAGAELPAGVRRVPDLATALRMHGDSPGLRVLGRGLPTRDREAARGRVLEFAAAPLPEGLVALEWTPAPRLGAQIELRGRWSGSPPALLRLLDPQGEVLDEIALAPAVGEGATAAAAGTGSAAVGNAATDAADLADAAAHDHSTAHARSADHDHDADHDHNEPGQRFALRTPGRAVGERVLRLTAVDAAGVSSSLIDVPLNIRPPRALRTLLLGGAPSPELRALRRWAADAGLDFSSRIQFAPGIVQGGARLQIDPAELSELDLLIVDERSWAALGPAGREAVMAATRDGLGVLLRLAASPTPPLRAELATQGFALGVGEISVQTQLPGLPTRLRRLNLGVEASDAIPLLRAADGEPLGHWRAVGLGRFGLLWLGDSFRLQASGEAAAYAALWSAISSTLARAPATSSTNPALHAAAFAWRGERALLCGLGAAADTAAATTAAVDTPATVQVIAPDGSITRLAAVDDRGCSAWWPRSSGLHRLGEGNSDAPQLLVIEPAQLPALWAAQTTQANRHLQQQPLLGAPITLQSAPGPFWPWLLALLAVLGLLWWLERPRGVV